MFSKIRLFISWLFLKIMFGLFILAASCALYAFWLERQDGDADFAVISKRYLADLRDRAKAAIAEREVAQAELSKLQNEFYGHVTRAEKAARLADDVRERQTVWRRYVVKREQSRLDEQSIERMEKLAQEERQLATKLRRPIAHAATRQEKAARTEQSLATQLYFTENYGQYPITHYIFRSWLAGWWCFSALAMLYYVGPALRAVAMYFFFAPHVTRKKSLRLEKRPGFSPSLEEGRNVVEALLWPGESARVRLRYLKSVDEGLSRESRLMMSWRFPLVSLLSGFLHDVNFRNVKAGRSFRLTFAHHKNPDHQMALVHVPEGGSLVVRPSFLAAVILPPAEKLQVRRRWQLHRWQAWVTAQLCFMEFVGPCRLVVAGKPGLRAERLDGLNPECRAVSGRIIGFTPALEYRLIRTARFWRYLLGEARLFDAHFGGEGFVLMQNHLPGKTPGLLSMTRNQARRLIGL